MTDISAVQEQWQQNLVQALTEEAAAVKQNDAYATTLAGIENRIKQARHLSRLKTPFIRATKIFWLHHKQKKLRKAVAAGKRHLSAIANSTVFSIAAAVVKGSAHETEYNRLTGSLALVNNAKKLVSDAAETCDTASRVQRMATSVMPPGPTYQADQDTKSAISAIRQAAQGLKSSQQHVDKRIPQIDATIADKILKGMTPSFMESLGYRIKLSELLGTTRDQLHTAGNELDQVKNTLNDEWCALTVNIVAESRATNPAVEKLMGSVQKYLPSGSATVKASQNNIKLQ